MPDVKTLTVHKYALPIVGNNTVSMPDGARVLSCGLQGSTIFLWVLCDPTALKEDRVFEIVGTGQPVPDNVKEFVGTVQAEGNCNWFLYFVWHIFELISPAFRLDGREVELRWPQGKIT